MAIAALGSVLNRAIEPRWEMDRCKGHAVAMQHEREARWAQSDSWTRPERRPGREWGDSLPCADYHFTGRGRKAVPCRSIWSGGDTQLLHRRALSSKEDRVSHRKFLISPLAVAASLAVVLLLRSVTMTTGQGPTQLSVKTGEWFYEPKEFNVAASSTVSLTLEHVGSPTIPHDIVFELAGAQKVSSRRILGGETDVFGFEAPTEPGEYIFYCSVGNHRARGMEGKLVVTGPGSVDPSPMMTDVGTGTPTVETTATENLPSAVTPTVTATPRPAYMPMVFRDPTATATPTVTLSPTATPTNTSLPTSTITATAVPPTNTSRPPDIVCDFIPLDGGFEAGGRCV